MSFSPSGSKSQVKLFLLYSLLSISNASLNVILGISVSILVTLNPIKQNTPYILY